MKKIVSIILVFFLVFAIAIPGLAELRKGSKGADVVELQKRLIELGYLDDTADGSFGKKTQAAVEAFQEANGLDVTGVVTIKDTTILFSDDAIASNGSSAGKKAEPPTPTPNPAVQSDASPDLVEETKAPAPAIKSEGDYEILRELEYSNYGTYHHIVIFRHSKPIDQKTTVNFSFYDANNSLVGVNDCYVGCTGAGYEYCAVGYNDDEYDHVEVSFTSSDLKRSTHCMDGLKIETTQVKDKVIIQAENMGEKPVSSCEYRTIFFNESDKVVAIDRGFLHIPDSEMQQGDKINAQSDPYCKFSRYEFFYDACNFGN